MPVLEERLSSTDETMRERYSVVIVGSGYGGSISAARLAELDELKRGGICLLERGLELHPGEYPDRVTQVASHIQVSHGRWRLGRKSAMFDFRFGNDVNVLVGCGLGGGSLINAGVSLPAPESAFANGWPRQINRASLDPFYDRARQLLNPVHHPKPVALDKFNALERSAGVLHERADPAPINVTFSRNLAVEQPRVHQEPCTNCGDCVSGCNVGAKNTLLMNYLPMARHNGVDIFADAGVQAIEKGSGQDSGKWVVHVNRPWGRRRRSASLTVVADMVILAAGTLGSTEILMRSKELGLPLSDELGVHFSANGDVLGFAFDGRSPVNAIARRDRDVGPCITGMVEVSWRQEPEGVPKRVLLEEGVIPSAIAPLIPLGLAGNAIRFRKLRLLKALGGPYRGALLRTLPYLMIYPDDDGGRMTFQGDRVKVEWPNPKGRPAYAAHDCLLKKAAEEGLQAMLYRQPGLDQIASSLTTVHPLGGCVMADDAQHGVVDADCRVFSSTSGSCVHDGLYVCDGSVVPTALGVNPLLTISALAERAAELIKNRFRQQSAQARSVP